MTEVTQELMLELFKRLHADIGIVKDGQREMRQDIVSLRGQMHLLQGDVNNIHATMGTMLDRLDRIENRLEPRELAEAQARFEPHP